ncbi:hypothetical protein PUN28_000044 [Cardiocondyla obscurior]|uniref:Uncharacterized protein n=1 Tax=Cardiocondyla obscurior TaxID=286306 RepID=A0AAW2GXR3_9HYME
MGAPCEGCSPRRKSESRYVFLSAERLEINSVTAGRVNLKARRISEPRRGGGIQIEMSCKICGASRIKLHLWFYLKKIYFAINIDFSFIKLMPVVNMYLIEIHTDRVFLIKFTFKMRYLYDVACFTPRTAPRLREARKSNTGNIEEKSSAVERKYYRRTLTKNRSSNLETIIVISNRLI